MHKDLQTLTDQLAEVNIIIGDVVFTGHNFTFDGTEDQFVNALEMFMTTHDYRKQDDNWFPGDPGEINEQDYFIMNDEIEFCISYDFKILSNLV